MSANVVLDRTEAQLQSSYPLSPWCGSSLKRVFDFLAAIILLAVLAPAMIVIAVLVRVTSRGPALFRQRRPGRNGRTFTILKFRTMVFTTGEAGPAVTRPADPRVTPFGAFMRRWKLDELPQLFNVLWGDMSFVGPRPLPTQHWEQPFMQEQASTVLSVRPGITSQATVKFRNEEELLASCSSQEVEDVYMKAIMPVKMRMNLMYLQSASFTSDFRILLRTVFRVFYREEGKSDFLIKEQLATGNQPMPIPIERRGYVTVPEEGD